MVASMHLVLSVPTNPNDTSKHVELSLQPGRANVTVGGKCPKNGTEEVKQGSFMLHPMLVFSDADSELERPE